MADFRIREKNTNGRPLEFNEALGALHDPRRAVRLPAVHPGGRHAILVSLSLSHSRFRRLVGRSPWTARDASSRCRTRRQPLPPVGGRPPWTARDASSRCRTRRQALPAVGGAGPLDRPTLEFLHFPPVLF